MDSTQQQIQADLAETSDQVDKLVVITESFRTQLADLKATIQQVGLNTADEKTILDAVDKVRDKVKGEVDQITAVSNPIVPVTPTSDPSGTTRLRLVVSQPAPPDVANVTDFPISPTTGFAVDPATGKSFDTATGNPINPATGKPFDTANPPIDPATGLPVDPATLPIKPVTGTSPEDPNAPAPAPRAASAARVTARTVPASDTTTQPVIPSAGAQAGTPFTVEVAATDENETVIVGYLGTVHFSSDVSATLPGDYTFLAADAGVHVFTIVLRTQGMIVVKVADVALPAIFGSLTIPVGA